MSDRAEKLRIFGAERCTLREEHVRLLRAACVSWEDVEYGAPGVDPKRPYGNSDVNGDIREALGVELSDAECYALHRGTEQALKVILSTGSFEPGIYETPKYMDDWERVG